MNCIRSIYRRVWRTVLLQYYLSDDKMCRVTLMYKNYDNDMFEYECIDGVRKLVRKEDLYNAFINDGFKVAEQTIKGNLKVYLSISKEEVHKVINKEKEKKLVKKKITQSE